MKRMRIVLLMMLLFQGVAFTQHVAVQLSIKLYPIQILELHPTPILENDTLFAELMLKSTQTPAALQAFSTTGYTLDVLYRENIVEKENLPNPMNRSREGLEQVQPDPVAVEPGYYLYTMVTQ